MATNNADFKVKKGLIVTEGITLGGHTFDDIDIGSEFVDTDDHLMSSGAIKEKIESYSYGTGDATLAGTQTFTGAKTFSSDVNLNDAGLTINELYGRINFKKDATTNAVNNSAIFFYNQSDSIRGAINYMYSLDRLGLQAGGDYQVYLQDGKLYPATDNDVDLGTSSLKFKDSFFGLVDAENFKVNGGQGADSQVLTSTGSGVAWEDASGIASLADDDSPQLGAALDTAGYDIVSTSNQHIDIAPHGTGDVRLQADTVQIGDSNTDVKLTTNGTGDLTIDTNSGTNSGSIVIADGANGNITLAPNGTGQVTISAQMTSKANVVAVTGTTQLTAAQSGSYVYVTGSGAVELPDNATVGLQYTIFNNKGSNLTVTLGTNNSIVSNWATNAAVSDNEATSYICVSATNWVQVG